MYQLTTNPDIVLRIADGASIPRGHRWWDEYEAWLAEGNTPQPIPSPTMPARIAALESALVAHVQAAVAARRWDSIATARARAGYAGRWQDEGRRWGLWDDECWAVAIDVMGRVMSGQMQEPTVEQFLATMPPAPTFSDSVVLPPKDAP